MKLIKDYRLMGFIVLVLIALALFLYSNLEKSNGVVVTYAGPNTPCKDILTIGSVITEITDLPIRNSDDFNQAKIGLEGIITIIVNNNPRSCNIPKNSTLDVTVEDVKKSGLSLSTELGGGSSYLFKPEGSQPIEQTIGPIKARIKQYDLVNTRVELSDDNLRIVSGFDEENYVRFLTEYGALEGRMILKASANENKSEFVFNDKTYKLAFKGNKSIVLNGSEYKAGDYFSLDGVKIKVDNVGRNTTTFFVHIFDESNLILIKDKAGVVSKRLVKQEGGYVFVFYVNLTKGSGESFAKATKGQEVTISSAGESFLKNSLVIFVDDQELINLPISGQDAGKEKYELVIWGYKAKMEDAEILMRRLISLIETGRLPMKLDLLKMESYTSGVGESYFNMLLIAVLVLSVPVSVLFLAMFKKRGIAVLPLILMCLSELLLIVGVISLKWFALLMFFFGVGFALSNNEIKDWKSWLSIGLMFMMVIGIVMSKWVLGVYSITGMIAALLVGFGETVFIGYNFLKKKEAYTQIEHKQMLKRIWLFTVVFSVLLFALLFFTQYREFAMATVVGLMASTTIVSPVYSSIIERIIK